VARMGGTCIRLRAVMLVAAAGWAVATLASGCAQPTSTTEPITSGRVVDLGHALSETDPTWDGKPGFSRQTVATIAREGYFGETFSTEEHFNTHVDAPAHFVANGLTVDRLAPDRLVHAAVCINIAAEVQRDEDYRLTRADVERFEQARGRIPAGAIVLVATGWDARWTDAARYMNEKNGKKHFPGLTADAATFLAKDRRVAAIGIDTPSIDYGPSEQFEAHHASMPEGVYHIENATGLTALPPTGFTVVVAPIKIKDGSGGPARVFALLPGPQ
jgi:kynurenine formamidase